MPGVSAGPNHGGTQRRKLAPVKDKMQVKVFMDSDAQAIEARINEWLDHLAGMVIKTETRVTTIAQKADDGTHPCIVTLIWYEPPSN